MLECMSAASNRASKQCKQPRIRQHTDGIVLVARPLTAENLSTPLTKQVWRTVSNARCDTVFGVGVQMHDDTDTWAPQALPLQPVPGRPPLDR
jgi:hypothetical protein